jgi:hypothetical protein
MHSHKDTIGVVGAERPSRGLCSCRERRATTPIPIPRSSLSACSRRRRGLWDHRERGSSGIARKAVLTRVKSQRDPRVLVDAVELTSEPERSGEANRPGPSIAQANRRNGRDDRSARRGHVRERSGQVTTNNPILDIGPHETTIPQLGKALSIETLAEGIEQQQVDERLRGGAACFGRLRPRSARRAPLAGV